MKLDFVGVLAAGLVHEQWKTVTQNTKCSVRDWQRSNKKASKKNGTSKVNTTAANQSK